MRQINLLPEEHRQNENLRIIRSACCLILLPLALGFAVIHVVLVFSLNGLQREAQKPPAQQETLESQHIRQEIIKAKQKAQGLVDQNKDLVERFLVNFYFSKILDKIGAAALDKVWLTGLNVDTLGQVCEIDGRAFNTRLVSEFILALKQIAYFKAVDLSVMEADQKAKEGEIAFKIVCNLK